MIGTIGYAGFSMTWMTAWGTQELGSTRFWPGPSMQKIGGGDLQVWAGEAGDPGNTELKRTTFQSGLAANGAEGIIFMVVAKLPWGKRPKRLHDGIKTTTQWIRDQTKAPIFLTKVPMFAPEVWDTGTLDGLAIYESAAAVDEFLANSPPRYVHRGPDMPLLDIAHCLPMPEHHPNELGRALLGQAWIDYDYDAAAAA